MSNETRGQDSVGIAIRQMAKNGPGHWGNPPTPIHPGASRAANGGSVRQNLMPGATTNRRFSNTAKYNPTNSIPFNSTIAPMVPRTKDTPNDRPAKRPRLNESLAQTNINPLNHSHEPSPAWNRLSSRDSREPVPLRHMDQLQKRLYGRESPDPIDSFIDERPTTSKRTGTPSATTNFPPIALARAKFEADLGPRPNDLPQMKDIIPPKKSRIAGMKSKDGKSRPLLKSVMQPGTSLNFTGMNDALSQSSMSPKRRSRGEVETISDADFASLKTRIQGLFFGATRHKEVSPIYLDFDETDHRLVLHIEDRVVPILGQDIDWLKSDHSAHLYVCISRGSKFERLSRGFWDPKTLDPEFPSHTVSFKFQKELLGRTRVAGVLENIQLRSKNKEPPRMQFSGIAWRALETSQHSKDSHKSFDGSSLSEPETIPTRDIAPIRPTRVAPTRSPVKRPMHSIPEVAKVDIYNDEIMLVYPFTGTGSTQITRGEQQRLLPGEYLNDTLIEFGLRFWLDTLKETRPDLGSQIHVFSPFFFKKLKQKDPQAGYDAVKKWTSKVDIFQKRYLVVPINERAHWYLAIVLYPENILRSITPTLQGQIDPQEDMQQNMQQDVDTLPLPDEVLETPESSLPSSRAPSIHEGRIDQDVEMRGSPPPDDGIALESPNKAHRSAASDQGIEDELLAHEDEDEHIPPDDSWKSFQDSTWLLSFDSLGGAHPSALKTLRHYLFLEAKHKKGIELDDSAPIVMTKKVPTPVQPNFWDCGVYLIRTVETFLEKPDEFFQRLMDKDDRLTEQHALWKGETFSSKRDELFKLISEQSVEWKNWKGPAEVPERATTSVAPSNRTTNSPPRRDTLFTEDEDDDIEIVGEQNAPRGRAARPPPANGTRRTTRFS